MAEDVSRPAVVLVVEDEALIRMGAVDALEEAGFKAVEAATAQEALRLLEARADIAAVVTDVEMPGQPNGYGLARVVHQRWPDLGIVIASGRSFPKPGDMPPGATFFSKPYDHDALIGQVRTVARIS